MDGVLTIALGVSAIVIVIVIVVAGIILKRVYRTKRKISRKWSSSSWTLYMPSTPPVNTTEVRCQMSPVSSRRSSESGYIDVKALEEKSGIYMVQDTNSSPDNNGNDVSPLTKPKKLAKSQSDLALETGPAIEFQVLYSSSTSSLTVHVTNISCIQCPSNPGGKKKNPAILIKIKLAENVEFEAPKLSTSLESVSSAARKSSFPKQLFDPSRGLNVSFPNLTLEQAQSSIVRFKIYAKRSTGLRDRLIEKVTHRLDLVLEAADVPLTCIQTLEKALSKPNKKNSIETPGHLLLLLHYDVRANRMKVLVRKGQDLPKRRRGKIGKCEYYVIINLLNGSHIEGSRETRTEKGSNPIWNQPFLFDIKQAKLQQYTIQFVVMEGRMYSRDGVLGQVLIGPTASDNGRAHWQEALQQKTNETARWHQITPLTTSS